MIIGKPIPCKRKPQRQNMFTPEIAEEILERLASPESLRNICRDEHMPSRTTVAKWAAEDPVFGARLKIAQKHQAAAMMDEAIEIVDNSTPERAYLDKNRAEMRRIYASKLDRENFGDEKNAQSSQVTPTTR
jgi:hypothetical protein